MSAGDVGKRKRITTEKLEELSDVLALGPTLAQRSGVSLELKALARRVGLSELQVGRIRSNPEFAERVLRKIRVRAIYLAAEMLETMPRDPKTVDRVFTAVLKLATGEEKARPLTVNNVNAQINEVTATTSDLVRGDRDLKTRVVRMFPTLGLVPVHADATIEGGSTSTASQG